ncbi:MAG: hypothetical protein ACI9GB_001122, partial [Halioglobus sp.]
MSVISISGGIVRKRKAVVNNTAANHRQGLNTLSVIRCISLDGEPSPIWHHKPQSGTLVFETARSERHSKPPISNSRQIHG